VLTSERIFAFKGGKKMTLENGGCCCNGGCNKPDFSQLEPVLDEYAKIPGSLIVATFYTQFRLSPIGKNLIMLCKGTACHVNGADMIEEAITEELSIGDGETTEDGIFTLNNVACLGCCSLAPVMMIRNKDGDETYGNLTKDSVKSILREIRKREQEVAQ
jgi:NADH:ubiquinone oxidoreductase subunit E